MMPHAAVAKVIRPADPDRHEDADQPGEQSVFAEPAIAVLAVMDRIPLSPRPHADAVPASRPPARTGGKTGSILMASFRACKPVVGNRGVQAISAD